MQEKMYEYNLSVIVPFYNDFENIDKAINSILCQKSDLKYEVIIVNNSEMVNIKKNYKKLKYLRVKNKNIRILNSYLKGASAARNLGIKKANGEYIAFLDSDDFLDDLLIDKLSKDILTNKYDLIKYCANRVENDKIIDNIKGKECIYTSGKSMLIDLIKYNERIFSPVWLYCIKKSVFKNNKIYFTKNRYHEDYGITSNILMHSKMVKSNEYIGYNYVHRKGSITRNNNYKIIKQKSFDFIFHSKNLLNIAKKKLNYDDFEIFRSYIIEQTCRKEKYLNDIDKKYFEFLLNRLKNITF